MRLLPLGSCDVASVFLHVAVGMGLEKKKGKPTKVLYDPSVKITSCSSVWVALESWYGGLRQISLKYFVSVNVF